MSIPVLPPGTSPELARDGHWQRLDPRMLLVHPIREVIRFLPALIGILVAGTAWDGAPWQLLGVAVPVALGVLRYLTTGFRITEGRVELRRGLLSRHTLTAPLDRVRTVDLTSSPIHRVLGLTTVRIGTGTTAGDDESLDLDGLPQGRARELRHELLRVAPPGRAGASASNIDHSLQPVAPTHRDEQVLVLDPSWARYAPLTSSGVVIAAAALGALTQLGNLTGGFRRVDTRTVLNGAEGLPLWVSVPAAVVALLVVVSLLSVLGYLVTFWGFALNRATSGAGTAWHLRRGLFTTRETSIDEDRIAGVSIGEPLGLRAAGAERLAAVVTGLDRKQQSASAIVPPAPRAVVAGVAARVLGTSTPVTVALTGHGPRATRRRWTRALVPALAFTVALLLAVLEGAPAWLLLGALVLPVAAGLAADRARSLGHGLVEGYLVARSGSLVRSRGVLAVEHVIGWNLRATFWQRRAGLTTLVATTAGGSQSLAIPDVPEERAVAVAAEAMPALLAQFRA